jgi:hypothetical protein
VRWDAPLHRSHSPSRNPLTAQNHRSTSIDNCSRRAGDFGGLPPLQNIDRNWKPISLNQLATLSAAHPDVTYYLPDGCGGAVKFVGGVPQGPSGLPPSPPIMTAPR